MSKIKKIIHDNEEKYIRFLAKLVAFDTSVIRHGEDGQEAKAQEWLAKYLENLGCEIEMFEPDNEKLKEYPGYNAGHSYVNRPNLIATYKGSSGGKTLVLNGHVDTMPSGDLARWKYNPYEGRIGFGHPRTPDRDRKRIPAKRKYYHSKRCG